MQLKNVMLHKVIVTAREDSAREDSAREDSAPNVLSQHVAHRLTITEHDSSHSVNYHITCDTPKMLLS